MTEVNRESRIRSLRPQAQNILWVSSGDVNDVAVVDERETFRFPRDEEGRRQLMYEFEVLQLLQNKLSLDVPKPVTVSDDNTFSIVSYIPGHSLTELEIQSLPEDKQADVGEAIAAFIVELNTVVDPESVLNLRSLRPEIENWDDWYDSMLQLAKESKSGYLTIFTDYLKKFKQAYPDGLSKGRTIIHDDLHAGNLIFDNDQKLVGVIDFGDVTLADIHRELRPVYRMGEHVYDAAINGLKAKFGSIDPDIVQTCAVVHELAVLIEQEAAGISDSRRAMFANSLLDIWLGSDWKG